MFALLVRRMALALLLMIILFSALDILDPSAPPMLITPADARAPEALTPETPALSQPSPYLIDGSTVVYVICDDGSSGSAVYLGSGRYITAAHVMTDEKGHIGLKCWIVGQAVKILSIDVKGDWAIVLADHFPPYHAPISCARLEEGATYYATGFADGNPWPVTTRIHGDGMQERDKSVALSADINGIVVLGMSGGSVADTDGFTHGIVDWRDNDGVPMGGVIELADTPLCKGKKS